MRDVTSDQRNFQELTKDILQFEEFHAVVECSHSKNKTPVSGSSIPVLGVKLKRG